MAERNEPSHIHVATDDPWITSGRTPDWEDGHDWRLLTFEKTYCPEPTTYDEELYCPELYCPEPTTYDTTSINTRSEGPSRMVRIESLTRPTWA